MNDRRRVLRRRLSYVLLFAALLLCCSVGSVLADTSSGEPSSDSETEASGQSGDDPRLQPPTGYDISQGIKEAERREAEREEWLAQPEAARERELSRTAYAALAPADAEALIERTFAGYLEALDSDPARFLSDAQLIRPVGSDETAGVVSDEGDSTLMDAGVPVQTEDDSGELAKVDVSLEAAGPGWETANALTDVVIPKSADAPVEIGEDGVSVTQVGAGEEATGRLLGGESVYFHEAMPDVGTIAAPVSGGAELFNVLFSEKSPERFEFVLDLPDGAVLQPDRFGGAEVTHEGETVGYVRFPTAVDAQGTNVPVDLQVEGETIAIAIEHRDQDLAYPLLLDPEFVWENWYTANWWNGYGLGELGDPNIWSPYASVPWILLNTWPIYSTFGGSNRGLFLHGNSGTWDANRYGQWTYTVPDWDSYIDHASLLPFWRDDHGCGISSYPEPHDYDGLWDGASTWIQFHANDARWLGYSNLPQWGKVFVVGIGSGNGGPNPCARDIYVGGAGVWLDDWSQPNLWTYPTAEWMDAVPNRQSVVAQDIGLGVRRFDVEATDMWGGPRTWQTWYPCIGTRASRCPEWWNLSEASQPKLNFDPSVLPEGIVQMNVTAYDAVLRKSTTTNTITVRVDHDKPTIKLSGTITEQATLGIEKSSYTVRVEASDGVPNSQVPSEARSGVASISEWVDGKKVNEYAPGCPTQSCSHFDEGLIEAAAYAPGQHNLIVKAKDALGHEAESTPLTFTLGDSQAPSLNVTGLPAESSVMPKHASYWNAFGANGTGNGQLKSPADVAVDSDGNLWVADKGNNRIQKFTATGEYISKFGAVGSGNGQLKSPADVAVDPKGNILVADKGNGRVQKFNGKGEYLAQFGSKGTGNGQFTSGGPEGIAVDAKGNIWVSDTYAGRVQKFDESGNFLKVVGSKGSGLGQLGEPTGIDVAPNGNVWVADWQNNRVAVFNEAGEFVTQFGSAGTGNGQFNRPDAIAVGSRGDIWVGDQNNGRLQEFDQNGTYLGQFGSKGSGPGQFNFAYPMGVATDSKGSLWIADTNNHRIQRWLVPNTTVSGYLEPLSATATDSGYGVTSVAVKLTDAAGNTEVLGQATQGCSNGGCPLNYDLDELDLSEKSSGPYLLSVMATDAAGNRRSQSRVVSLDSTPPEIDLSGALAESAGQPLTVSSAELEIGASDADPASGGISEVNVERAGQLVARYPSDCSSDCHEVEASYTFHAAADGADRSIKPVSATGNGSIGELKRVSCVASSDCWAVGRTKYTINEQMQEGKVAEPLLEHWDGNEWQTTAVPKLEGAANLFLEGVSCAAANACLAVGSYSNGTTQPLVEIWNGSSWTASAGPLPAGANKGSLHGVSCSAANDCWVYGKTQATFAEMQEGKAAVQFFSRWNGSGWQTTVTPKPEGATSITLEGISCASANACLAVGSYNNGTTQPLVEIWNGSSWTASAGPLPAGSTKGSLGGVSCGAAGDCWAFGKTQISFAEQIEGKTAVPFFSRWNGSGWQVEVMAKAPDGSSATVTSLSCDLAAACTAVGRYSNPYGETLPLAYTWDAAGWRFQPMPIKTEASNSSLESVSCTAANECASVGYSRVGSSQWQVLAEAEAPDGGPHEVTVEAIDAQGNAASETIEIDAGPEASEAPECHPEVASVAPQGVLSSGQAVDHLEESLPSAVAPSEGAIEPSTEEQIDPSYSPPSPNLEAVDSLAESEASVTPDGGFTLANTVCFTPTTLTTAATVATVANGDAAVFANTAPETDTMIRPTAMGAMIVQSLRGPEAPESFSWTVTVGPEQEVIELPSGAVAIIDKTTSGPEGDVNLPTAPAKSPQDLADVEAQIEKSEYQLAEASNETPYEVLAVIARPWIVLAQGGIVPALIEVAPVIETPNEFEVIVSPSDMEAEGEEMVIEATASKARNGHCLPGDSPCGQFDAHKAAGYAKYWGNWAEHGRNENYPDYDSNNCTNFMSQVIRKGGMRYIRAYDDVDGAWWYWCARKKCGMWWNTFDHPDTWSVADLYARHLWRYGLVHIDPVNQPWGWTIGNILAYDWLDNGKGNFDHLQYVVGTVNPQNGSREPLMANHSSPDYRYGSRRWVFVKKSIEESHPGGQWARVPLAIKHTHANWKEKKHAPQNLYGPNGIFQG